MVSAEMTTFSPSFLGDGLVRAPIAGTGVHATRWHGRYITMLSLGDGLAIVMGVLVAQAVRFEGLGASEPRTGAPYLVLSLLLAPLWVLSVALNGAYDHRRVGTGAEEYRRIFDAALRFVAALALVALSLKLDVARSFVAIALVLATAFTEANHHAGARWLRRRREAGECMHRVLVVGHERQVADLVRRLRNSSDAGLAVVGACVSGWGEGQLFPVDHEPVPVLGATADVLDPRRLTAFDSVAVADHDASASGSLRDLLRGSGVDLLVAPTVTDVTAGRITVVPVDGLPLLHLRDSDASGLPRLIAEGIERVLAGLVLVAVLPALAAAALAIRLTSKGPALFPQVRLGQGGRPFTIWKLRTMRAGAEAERDRIAHLNEHDGLLFKIRHDPRITPVGSFLRRFSIDEVPQLWNVLRGDMSLVGPRPALPDEVGRYTDVVRRRLLVKPGLTGLWQVSGRADLPWQQGLELDLYYVDNRSLTGDLAILCRTATAVLRGRGAY